MNRESVGKVLAGEKSQISTTGRCFAVVTSVPARLLVEIIRPSKSLLRNEDFMNDVRVIKHMKPGIYDTYASFPTVKEAVEYMRNWNPNATDSWYIIDANDNVLRTNQNGELVVTYKATGVTE
jgi:hypothetical protein